MIADTLRRAKKTGGNKAFVGSFVKPSAAGNTDIALPAGCPNLSVAPPGTWAIIFWTDEYPSASGVWAAHAATQLGFVANGGGALSQYSVSAFSQDAVGTTNTSRRVAAAALTMPDTAGSTVWTEAQFVSFPDATHMRLNWTTSDSNPTPVNFMILTGLTGAKVVNTLFGGTGGPLAVTGVGFSPDLVIHATVEIVANASATHSLLALGAVNKHGQQWASSIWSSDAVGSNVISSRYQRTDRCLAAVRSDVVSERVELEAKHTTMDSGGYTIQVLTDLASSTWNLISLCVKGVSSKLGSFVNSTTSPQVVNTRHGFAVRGAFFANVNSSPMTAPGASNMLCLGASDGVNHRAISHHDLDQVTPTQVRSAWFNDAALACSSAASTTGLKGSPAFSTVDMTMTYSPDTSSWEHLYMLLGDGGINTYPTTIDSTGVRSAATAYGNQKTGLTLSNGVMWMVRADDTAHGYPYYSVDGGVNWYYGGTEIAGWLNGSISSYVDSGGVERIVAVWKQSGTGGTPARVTNSIYMMVGTLNATRDAITWGTAVAIDSAMWSGLYGSIGYPDVAAHAEGTGGKAHIAISYLNGAANATYVYSVTITGDVVSAWGASGSSGFVSASYNGSVNTFPSIDVDPVTKRVHVAWHAGTNGPGKGIRYKTGSYSAGTWTWAAEVEVDNAYYIDVTSGLTALWLSCRWDGTRVVIGGQFNPIASSHVRVWDSTDFVTFTNRYDFARTSSPLYSAANSVDSGGMAVNKVTGDVYLFGQLDGNYNNFGYWKLTRTGAALARTATVITVAGAQTGPRFVKPWYSTGRLNWVYANGAASPFTVKYDRELV